jgi:hypothetical protein
VGFYPFTLTLIYSIVVAETNMPNSMIGEHLTGHFIDEIFDLGEFLELFNDDFFSNIAFELDFDVGI